MRGALAHRRARRGATLALAALMLGLLAADDAPIYRWEDERGVPHFSDRAEDVPPAFRAQLGLPPGSATGEGASPTAASPSGADDAAGAIAPWKRFETDSARQALEAMPTSMWIGAAFAMLAVFGVFVAFGALVLLAACRLVGQESPGFGRAYGIVIVQTLATMVVAPGVVLLTGTPQSLSGLLGSQVLQMGATLLVQAGVLRAMLCERFGRALAVAVMVTVVSIAIGVVFGLAFVTCGLGGALMSAGG